MDSARISRRPSSLPRSPPSSGGPGSGQVHGRVQDQFAVHGDDPPLGHVPQGPAQIGPGLRFREVGPQSPGGLTPPRDRSLMHRQERQQTTSGLWNRSLRMNGEAAEDRNTPPCSDEGSHLGFSKESKCAAGSAKVGGRGARRPRACDALLISSFPRPDEAVNACNRGGQPGPPGRTHGRRSQHSGGGRPDGSPTGGVPARDITVRLAATSVNGRLGVLGGDRCADRPAVQGGS